MTKHDARFSRRQEQLGDLCTKALARPMAALDEQMRLLDEPFLPQIEPLDRLPGGNATAARAILGEIGTDRRRFGAAARWAS